MTDEEAILRARYTVDLARRLENFDRANHLARDARTLLGSFIEQAEADAKALRHNIVQTVVGANGGEANFEWEMSPKFDHIKSFLARWCPDGSA